jgi:hypothetical protein
LDERYAAHVFNYQGNLNIGDSNAELQRTNYDTPLPRFAAVIELAGAPTGKL